MVHIRRGVLTGLIVVAVIASPNVFASVMGTGPVSITTPYGVLTVAERDQLHGLFNNEPPTNQSGWSSIEASSNSSGFQAGASWNWPSPKLDRTGYAYAHLYHGLGLGKEGGLPNTDNRFPFTISSYTYLTTTIPNVRVSATGNWAIAFDMFLFHDKAIATSNWEVSNVQQELFIIVDRDPAGNYQVPNTGYPGCTVVSNAVTSGGVKYNYGTWPSNVNEAIFWRTDKPTSPFSLSINIYDFFNYVVQKGKAQTSNVFPFVGLGVDEMVGSGTFSVDSYYWTLSSSATVTTTTSSSTSSGQSTATSSTTATTSSSRKSTSSTTTTQMTSSSTTSTSSATTVTSSTQTTIQSTTSSTSTTSLTSTNQTGTVPASPLTSFSQPSASVGSTVHVSGSGFSSTDTSCSLSGSPVNAAYTSCMISNGALFASFVVANVASGSYTVTATGSPVADYVSATFIVSGNAPYIALNPVSALIGSTVQVFGGGFSASDSSCSLSSGSIASKSCSIAGGSVTGSFIVANVTAGSYTVTVTGTPTGDSASATLTVTSSDVASVTFNPAYSLAGATVQVSGSSFPSADSSCSMLGTVVSAPACSIIGGALSGSFIVANVTVGSYVVRAVSSPSGNSASSTFTVTSLSTMTTTTTSTNSSTLTTSATDFAVTSTSNVTLTQGGNKSGTVYVISINGFSSSVALSASWVATAPVGVSVSIPSQVTSLPDGTVTVPLTITASPTAPIGTFALQITGTSRAMKRTTGVIPVQVLPRVSTANRTTASMTTPIPTVCPVSAASSGSALAPLAQALRTFRDQSIMKTRTGAAFLTLFNAWYYSFSPHIASYIGSYQVQRTVFRYGLYPLIGLLYASYYSYLLVSPFNAEVAAVTSGLVAAGMIGIVYLALPSYVLMRIFKRKASRSSWPKSMRLLPVACSIVSGVGVGISYIAGTVLVLGIATAGLILSTLTLGALLGDLALTRIEFAYPAQGFAASNRVFTLSAWNHAMYRLNLNIEFFHE